jgi:prepilin-type N-terminal cleavage/methylation domain-containing protein
MAGFRRQTGYTLVELLVATVVAGIATSLAIGSFSSLLSSNRKTVGRSLDQLELNRGLDFIAAEVRQAATVVMPPTCPTASCTAVLELNLPNLPNPVRYYLDDATAGTEVGPRAIVRQGATFDSDGDYDSSTTVTATLMDAIGAGSAVNATDCANSTATVYGDSEFFVCVAGVRSISSELHLRSQDDTEVKTTVFSRVSTTP